MNSTFLSKSPYDFTPSPHAIWITFMQLQHPSTQAAIHKAHENRQYLIPLAQLSKAGPDSPSLQSMHRGAHSVQQQALQQSEASPQASIECHWSMQLATLQAQQENQQHWQHFLRKSAISTDINSIIMSFTNLRTTPFWTSERLPIALTIFHRYKFWHIITHN